MRKSVVLRIDKPVFPFFNTLKFLKINLLEIISIP